VAEQAVAFEDDQDTTTGVFGVIFVGKTASETVGAAATSTVTALDTVPPGPEHPIANTDRVLIAALCSEPFVGFVPDHAPVPEQVVAFVLVQANVTVDPEATMVRSTVKETVGAGGGGGALTVTRTLL
jgi:hypothetical protein